MTRSTQMQKEGSPDKARRPKGSPGMRCYAIGDVHGCLDLLQEILRLIEQHDADREPRDTVIVLLGDLIDRGPDSSGVIEFVRTYRPARARVYVLAGNHEELMLRALDGDTNAFQAWMLNGGGTTALSYGFQLESLVGVNPEQMPRRLAACIPPIHVSFLRFASDSIRFGDYLLTHAGVRPGVALADQTPSDLHWIRTTFLESDIDHGFVVVHGHSMKTEIEVKKNRIGIDTGAYHSGVLTALWIEDDLRGFLQAVGVKPQSEADDVLFG